MPVDLTDTRALVVGLGVSGNAAAEALQAAGAQVRVVEPGRGEALEERAARLAAAGVEVLRGQADVAGLLAERTLVVPSPVVAPHAPLLVAARRLGLEIVSEPELAWRMAGGRTRLVAVTGTNGKTSTTELLAALLGVPAGGNIGMPLTAMLSRPAAALPPLVVTELSSFQLRHSSTLAPDVALMLNLAPDHLDWHGSFVAYGASKARIWGAQSGAQLALVNADDAEASGLFEAHPPPARRATFGLAAGAARDREEEPGLAAVRKGRLWWHDAGGERRPLLRMDELAVTGRHQLSNVCAAVTAAVAAGADPDALGVPLRAFRPGTHRLQRVATINDVAYVDDSKATNPHAAAAALASYPSVVWIAGGLNKGLSFDGLASLLPGRVRATVTIGSSGPALAAVARGAGIPVVEAGILDEAVRASAELARPGDTVLLAPACASMDQFTDYAARGRAFAQAVARLKGAATAQETTNGH
ncbi:MAG: UDP-N-acetylmuramoyl-L-alanine--D-glutamate ligase [Nitriliruptorales bacterium]|nr:UDP-N-acetylmuramoyl-L-alanine--D-glutamate ligase [Nitriliruptorales bacterium]